MQKPINFGNAQASGSDELGGAQPVAMNVITEPTGAVRRRPGLRVHPEAPGVPVDDNGLSGVHRLLSGDMIAVSSQGPERAIYRVTGGASVELGGGGAPAGLRGTGVPSFAETEMLLVLAGGGEMQKVELSSWLSTPLNGSPPQASHVIANAQRLLANDLVVDRTKVRYSSPAQGTTTYAGHEQWLVGAGTAGFFTAEARPDPVVAIGETTNEIFVFGQYTTEVYGPEPTLRFQRIAAQEVGCGAPAGIVKADEQYFWLDHQKRIVMGNGRGFENIGEALQRTLDAIDDISGAIGFRVRIGACDAVAWSIPSVGKTFVYQRGAGWGQWAGWDGNWTALGVTGLTGTDTVSTESGYIGQFTFDATTDFGAPIKAYVRSGFQNHDTDAFKSCKRVQLSLRRGQTSEATGEVGSLWYQDRPGAWEYAGPIDLGGAGDTEIVLDFPSLGSYRRRDWRVEFSGAADFVLVGATEEFEVTGY